MTNAIERQRAILGKAVFTEDHSQKQKLLEEVVAIDPGTPYGLFAQGALAFYEDADEAIQKIQEAIKLQPDFPIAHNDLGMAY